MSFGIGVIGATGFIGTPYREEIRRCGDVARIVALCARRRDLLEAAGREDGADLLTDDWRQVVEHPDVNLVIVATPDVLHHEEAMACAAAGKHLFCEKPVGLNVGEAADIWSAYRDSGLAHFVPFWTRYLGSFSRAREIVRSGTLGDIRSIVYRWHNPRPESMPFTWRDDAAVSSAGSIADVGSHGYDTLRWITGLEATRVLTHADVISPAKPHLGEVNLSEAIAWGESHPAEDAPETRRGTAYDYASISFQADNGAVGTLVLSHAPFFRKWFAPELELHGTKASLAVNRSSGELSIARGLDEAEVIDTLPHPGWGNRFGDYVFPAMQAAIAGDATHHPDLQDGYRVQLFTDAAAMSARDGRWVELKSIDPIIE